MMVLILSLPHLPNILNKEIFSPPDLFVDVLTAALLAGSCCSHLFLAKKKKITGVTVDVEGLVLKC